MLNITQNIAVALGLAERTLRTASEGVTDAGRLAIRNSPTHTRRKLIISRKARNL